MKFSLLHPSRGRAYKSLNTTSKWISNASSETELIVSIDENDATKDEYMRLYNGKVIVNNNRSSVEAVNNAAKVSTGDILIVVSDDTDCPANWDRLILSAIEGRKDFVLKVYDGIQKWIITMPIIDREYYDRFGYVYHPEYAHLFCDTEFTHVADVTKKVIWRNDIMFRHNHYSIGRSQRDHVSIVADSTAENGAKVYLKRFKENFGLHGVDVWDISSDGEGHRQWIKAKLL